MKTKLGVSVGLFGAATYFMGLFSGYVVLAIMVGYVLLCESNEWLRRSAVKAFAVCVGFSVLSALVGFIPNIIGFIDDIFNIFNSSFSISIVSKIVTFINTVIALAQKILLLVLGFKALHQGTVKIGIIDKLINDHMKADNQ